jgi:hypothetical protein
MDETESYTVEEELREECVREMYESSREFDQEEEWLELD